MPQRNESEKDFELKAAIRAILWAQGYSTRIDVLLAYEVDPKGRSASGKAGLTDLDVLGVRLDSGVRVHNVVADCKTSAGRVPERLFWLCGVSKFFGSDTNLLVRSRPLPEHASTLARSLDITVVGPADLEILTNTYVKPSGRDPSKAWQEFFSAEVLGEALTRLSSLPASLRMVEVFRESLYWMEPSHVKLQRSLAMLQHLSKESSRGPTFQLIFADFIWLFVIALWDACEVLNANGLSRPEHNLQLYLSGNESGLLYMQRVQRTFDSLLRRFKVEAPVLALQPPYFPELLELLVRCLRRPEATSKMARRAEWLTIGQMVGGLGAPPNRRSRDDLIAEKLLGDVARFVVRATGLHESFLESYLGLLQNAEPIQDELELPAVEAVEPASFVEVETQHLEVDTDGARPEYRERQDDEVSVVEQGSSDMSTTEAPEGSV